MITNLSETTKIALEKKRHKELVIQGLISKLQSQNNQLENLIRKIARLQVEVKYLKKEIVKNGKILQKEKKVSVSTTINLSESIYHRLEKMLLPEIQEEELNLELKRSEELLNDLVILQETFFEK